jgi:glycine/D-amino acid oxidase-like deaminating enzyme
MNPARRALALAEALGARASLREHTVASTVDSKRVVTDRGVISAGIVIAAVDGRLDELLPQLETRVRTARLQMLATAPIPPRLPCPVYGRWGYDYAQQDADGRLYVGGGRDHHVADEWTLDATPTAAVQAWIEAVAERMAAGPVGVTHRWAASVGYTPDARPLCVQTAPGVVAIGGYSGTGNLVGPATARAAVALLLDGTPPPSWCAT